MALSNSRRKQLRTLGHKLNPIVTIGDKGLSEAVSDEIERALNDHELIKIKLNVGDPSARRQMAADVCEHHGATLVQTIGKVALILREAKQPDPRLSNLLRPV